LYLFPFFDQVDWILFYLRDRVSSLFARHNEHRPPISRGFQQDVCAGVATDQDRALLHPDAERSRVLIDIVKARGLYCG
jgi:hypothetical protein